MSVEIVLIVVSALVILLVGVFSRKIDQVLEALDKFSEPVVMAELEESYVTTPESTKQLIELAETLGKLLHSSIPADALPDLKKVLEKATNILEEVSDDVPISEKVAE